jgi:hypothetical protein
MNFMGGIHRRQTGFGSSLPMAAQRQQVMRHGRKSGVNHLVVHREDEDIVEEFVHECLEGGCVLAVDVALLALQ